MTALALKRRVEAALAKGENDFINVGGVAGLHLQVSNTGATSWILRKVVGTDRVDLGLGGFPDITLEMARDNARAKCEQIKSGIDPRAARREAAAALKLATVKAMTFDEAAHACFDVKAKEFKNAKHKGDWLSSVTAYASPVIGSLPVKEVDRSHVFKVLQPIWAVKTETATRLRQRIEVIMSWSIANRLHNGPNPAAWKDNLKPLLPAPTKIKKVRHHPALPWAEVGAFMANLKKVDGMGARALEFAILCAARSGEVRGATWDEIDFKAKLWTIPGERMKAGKAHRVPLSAAAIKLLKALPRFEGVPHVFAAPRGGQLSDMTLNAVTRRMKVEAVPHGFRSTFKDWCRGNTSHPDEVSELALAHVNDDQTRAAYARDELLPKRKLLMDEWAAYCSVVRRGGKAVSSNRKAK